MASKTASKKTSSSSSSKKSSTPPVGRTTPPKDDPAAPVVGSLSGRQRQKDIIKQNDVRNLPDEHRPHDDGDKPVPDVETALQVLRDATHPGTPYGYVTDDDTHRDTFGVAQVNKKDAAALQKEGLASVYDSKIRLTAA